ncbi:MULTISPECIES: phosphoglycerate dehydrogenase [Hydrocarboniphaga]|jgi:D-3-phosphoglycerate dehydrogenase|uniref:D-3-phosphoglycerate dehydrogenase n=1 Tax=Hydrocarboniphaga effusa AP103 TaxID=1172194 RepID=I7ZCZ6_9GAMM|nr:MULTISPECIES: phosphoglycerate dehydrogenase [Hydrocarboniphaga]EIT69764.1 D-3-phosphoglycerate dehydrogenase [Hydrocarboniphaga effusa AP103]MDZ4078854.1 phosphoglycerate dehydrogenase [Hydrocarboniphaga sp.]
MKKTSFPKQDIKVLLLEGVSRTALDTFRSAGYTNIEFHEKSLPEAELAKAVASAHIVGIRSRSNLTAEMFQNSRRLMAVGAFCIGTNQIALDAAQARGIPVFNAPYSNTRSVAELVVAEAIMLMRRIPEKDKQCHVGGWSKSAVGSFEVRGKTLGIVGYGHIGTQVGVLAESLGMRVIYYDIETQLALGNAQPVGSLHELLGKSDIVTLHVPETAGTQWMIGAPELAAMKPGGLLINASRGTVVVIEALAEAIKSGHVGGAAVDVFPVEPKGNAEAFVSPLQNLPNVILTPHIGGSTLEAQENIGFEVAAKLVRYSDNGSTLSAVNFPEVSLPEHPRSRRLLHIHRNMPGMLTQINNLFSDQAVNIDAQFLQTAGQVGYVVIDVSASEEQAETLKDRLAAIPGTLKTRLLY